MTPYEKASRYLQELLKTSSLEDIIAGLSAKEHVDSPKLPRFIYASEQSVKRRWELLNNDEAQAILFDEAAAATMERYQHNIENYIGTVRMPVGVAGPLKVNGLFAQGDYFVPLATTEAALVASYSRGAQLITASGGCTSMLLSEGVSRAPGFVFQSLIESGMFVNWVMQHLEEIKQAGESTTRHGKFSEIRVNIEGNHVYLNIEFFTGDASGQNMVTIATQAICDYIEQHSPVRPQHSFIEANYSGDKKASSLSYLGVRGKKVSAEVTIPAALVKDYLRTTPEKMMEYWKMSAIGGVLSGTMGVQGHYANGLAALYIACGQDAACVSESAVGVTRIDVTERGELYMAVTLPNLIVGTIGGGTGLPTQQACLSLMGLAGTGKARAFAEVAAGLLLAGELSIIGALCAGDFTRAHRKLAREGKKAT